jgi:hypothetical protein
MPHIHYDRVNRELRIRLADGESEAHFIDFGTFLTQFLDRNLRVLGGGITSAMADGNGEVKAKRVAKA